jgi:copper chaperone CopZ
MKTFSISLLFFVGILVGSARPAQAQFVKANLQVSGLTCSMCSFATLKQLQTLPFIDSINTDLEHSRYLLVFKKDQPISIDQIKRKVEDAGFSVAGLTMIYHFSNQKIENDYHLEYNHALYHFMQVKEQVLNGDVKLRVIDKGFIPDREYKKFLKSTTMPCYVTGKMPDVDRVYHVSLS